MNIAGVFRSDVRFKRLDFSLTEDFMREILKTRYRANTAATEAYLKLTSRRKMTFGIFN